MWTRIAVGAVIVLGAAAYFVRLGDIEEGQRANCRSANEAKIALSRFMDESVAVRYAQDDPAAAALEASFGRLKDEFLRLRECG